MKFRNLKFVTIVIVIIAFVIAPLSVYAKSIKIESKDITVETKDTPTSAIVVDERGLFSKEQISQIENAGKELEVYDVGLYVEMTDKKTCTQSYANSLAEEKYTEILKDKPNSIMIVFSFYKEAYGYYAIHYNMQGDLSEYNVSNIIQNSYHDFKTDSEWVVGSFKKIVNYLKDVEYELINADALKIERDKQREESLNNFYNFSRIVLEVIALIVIIILAIFKYKDKKYYENAIYESESDIKEKAQTIKANEQKIDILEKEKEELNEWKKNAKTVNSEIDSKISDYLARIKASEFDKKYSNASSFDKLDEMITEYEDLSAIEKEYITLDIKSFKKKYDKLLKEKVDEATNYIKSKCDEYEGNRHYRYELDDTLSYYNHLPSSIRVLIAVSVITNLKNMHSDAQRDYRNYTYHSSSSSSSYSSSFGGGFSSGTFGGGFGGGH